MGSENRYGIRFCIYLRERDVKEIGANAVVVLLCLLDDSTSCQEIAVVSLQAIKCTQTTGEALAARLLHVVIVVFAPKAAVFTCGRYHM